MRHRHWIIVFLLATALFSIVSSQSNIAGFLTVGQAVVELQRADTDDWVPVQKESVIGTGDAIRTSAEGKATLIIIGGGVEITLAANTEIFIETLLQQDDSYTVSIQLRYGDIAHRILTSNASYSLTTPSLRLLSQRGEFLVSQPQGQPAGVVVVDGTVTVSSGTQALDVGAGFAVRLEADGNFSPALPVNNLALLASAVDGVSATFSSEGDVLLNVRRGPDRSAEELGQIAPDQVKRVLGVSEDKLWYRIRFLGEAGWILSKGLQTNLDPSTLAVFPNDFREPTIKAATVIVGPSVPASSAPAAGAPVNGDPASTTPAGYSSAAMEVLTEMNKWRLEAGLQPFVLNSTLSQMAQDQGAYLRSLPQLPEDYDLLHRNANGLNPRERAYQVYGWLSFGIAERTTVGENLYDGARVAAAINFWKNSPVHAAASTNPGYREIGVADYPSNFGRLYIVVFGSRPDILPASYEPTEKMLYLTNEESRYGIVQGAKWLQTVVDFQIVPSALSPLDENGWQAYQKKVAVTQVPPFTVAMRDASKKVVFIDVKPVDSIVWLPSNLPAKTSAAGATPAPLPADGASNNASAPAATPAPNTNPARPSGFSTATPRP